MATKRKSTSKRARTVKVIRNTDGYVAGGKFHPAKRRVKKAVTKKKAARKNPSAASFPIGKFVKVDKVRVNTNGTIDVMRSKGRKLPARRPKR